MSIYSWSGEKIGSEVGAYTGRRKGLELYNKKSFFVKLFTNKENFIKKYDKEGREEGKGHGKKIGIFASVFMGDIIDIVSAVKNELMELLGACFSKFSK